MPDLRPFESAIKAFIAAPSGEKLQALNDAAVAYREAWIEARAGEVPVGSAGTAEAESTRYKRVIAVNGQQPDGTELVLALQSRTSRRENHTWYVVSWRTRLKPGGHNRRFYLTAGSAWSMPAGLALEMLESLQASGGLDARFEDNKRRPDFQVAISTATHGRDSEIPFSELMMEGESWGPLTEAIVTTDPHDQWRKVMLFDPDARIVTFRSLTKNTNYMPRTDLRPGCVWFLDNSMQDTNVQQARAFLDALRRWIKGS